MSGVLFRLCATIISMPLAAWLLPGVHAESPEASWAAGIFLGVIYLLARPLAKLLLAPFHCLTFGLVGFVLDALLVMLATHMIGGFTIDGFLWAFVAALIVLVLREVLGRLADNR